MQAIAQGVARIPLSHEELFVKSSSIIKRAREETRVLMEAGIIATAPSL
jgi:hypothetical protein